MKIIDMFNQRLMQRSGVSIDGLRFEEENIKLIRTQDSSPAMFHLAGVLSLGDSRINNVSKRNVWTAAKKATR